MNSNDLLIANGKMNTDNIPTLNSKDYLVGKEFSGRDLNGKRIMGLVSSKGIATTVLVDPHLLWEVPDTWSLEQAATVPLIYTTVRKFIYFNSLFINYSDYGGIYYNRLILEVNF